MSSVRKITTTDDCVNCPWEYKCCTFEKEDRNAAPLFTKQETEKLWKKHKINIKKHFKKYKGSGNIFQVKLVKSRHWDLLICPFLDEKTNLCNVYDCCPLDCKLWPFFIAWNKNKKKTALVCFNKNYCPALMKINKKEFEDYKKYIIKFVTSRKFINFLKKNPEYIWKYDRNIFVVKDLTDMLEQNNISKKK